MKHYNIFDRGYMEADIHMHININNSKGNEFRMTKACKDAERAIVQLSGI